MFPTRLPPLPPWSGMHPLVVHFPIAILLVAPLFIILAMLWKSRAREMLLVSCILVTLGTAGALLAANTGEAAEKLAEAYPGVGPTLDRHEELAEITENFFLALAGVLLVATAAFWFLSARVRRSALVAGLALYLLAYAAGALVLVNTAHEGGKLVHELGVSAWKAPPTALAPTAVPSSPPAPAQPTIALPALADTTPAERPGLHNLVAYAPGIVSGSLPEGDEGFDSLRAMGVRTVISVDGAEPDLARAESRGLRYVHLPTSYSGIDDARRLEIARAVRDLPHPIYIHCHHGKHRSAAAAGAAAVILGELTSAAAIDRMRVSGTSPAFAGLYACVSSASVATPADLNAAPATFPAVTRPTGLVASMIDIDTRADRLKAVAAAGWRTSPPQGASLLTLATPESSPAIDAAAIADLYRALATNERVRAKPAEFAVMLAQAERRATDLEEAILSGKPAESLTSQWKLVTSSCTECHAKFRD